MVVPERPQAPPAAVGARTTIAVCVCTYRRNEPLHRLLASVAAATDRCRDRVDVGVVVVDDNSDARARSVVDGDSFRDAFPLGVCYVFSGQQNIAKARNLAVDRGCRLAEWVAMVDDDVVVPPDWFHRLLDIRDRTGADAVTGPMQVVFPEGSPRWLTIQPFAEIGAVQYMDDGPVDACATSNTLLRGAWWQEHPEIRFDDELGRLGGEDMVFFRRSTAAGLRAHYSTEVAVRALEPAERSTFKYQLRRAFWMGNSAAVTNRRLRSASPVRLLCRGGRRCLRAAARVLRRARSRQTLDLRYAVAGLAEGLGMMFGAIGVVVRHR